MNFHIKVFKFYLNYICFFYLRFSIDKVIQIQIHPFELFYYFFKYNYQFRILHYPRLN